MLSPSHVTGKWVREIYETLPNTKAAVIHNITELQAVYRITPKTTVQYMLFCQRNAQGTDI